MSPSPANASDRTATQQYTAAWKAVMHAVRSGSSWSGRERNCVFLNGRTDASTPEKPAVPRYANISAVSGLDFPDDGRAVAVVDWDGDGDLDVWLRNRTAPRLRLMRNRTRERQEGAAFLAVLLEGTQTNRDAVGARVEMVLESAVREHRFVQTVRAGDAFLSQSSRWLHFGIPRIDKGTQPSPIAHLDVYWPGGSRERFTGLQPNRRYRLVQGSGKPVELPARSPTRLTAAATRPLEPTATARVILPSPVLLPHLALRPLAARKSSDDAPASTTELLANNRRPTLLTLWVSTCPHCRAELTEFAEQAETLRQSDIQIVAINLDRLGKGTATSSSESPAQRFLEEIQFPFPAFTTDESSIARWRYFEQTLFDKFPPAVVPLSVLVNSEGELVCMYRGRLEPVIVTRDIALLQLENAQLRDLAVPLRGTWITRPATKADFAEYVGQRIFPEDAQSGLRYYRRALQLAPDSAPLHFAYALRAANAGDTDDARKHLIITLRLQPNHQAARTLLTRLGDDSSTR